MQTSHGGLMRRTGILAARIAALSLLLTMVSACGDKKTVEDAPLSASEAQYLSEESLWRIQRQEKLTQPDGWTSLIGLHWLSLQSHYVGSSARSGIRIEIGPESLGMFQRNNGKVFFTPERGLALTLDDQPFKGRVELKDDSNGAASVLGFDEGKGKLTVIQRGGNRALRVKHADATTRTQFKGLDYWPANRDWRVEATFVPHPAGTTLPIASIIGTTDNTPNPGAVEFQREGKTYRIEALDQGRADAGADHRRPHQRPRKLWRGPLSGRGAPRCEWQGGDRFQPRLQPAVRVHTIRHLSAAAEPESSGSGDHRR